MDLLDRMLAHDHWATSQVLELSRGLTDEQLDQPFDIGHGTLRETLDHVVYVIDFWTRMMAGQPAEHDRRTLRYDRSIPALIERHARFHAAFADLARRVRDEGRLDDTFVDHFGLRPSLGGAIVQVIEHNVEHRTEAAHMLLRLGVGNGPLEVDHLLWEHLSQAPPQPGDPPAV